MNAAHLHIMINHFPMIGLIFTLAFFLAAALRGSQQLARIGTIVLVAVAAVSIVVYLTGEPAEEIVENMAGASEEAIEHHEQAALIALIAIEALGAFALAALVAFRPPSQPPRWYLPVVFVSAIAVAGWVAWTANLGGRISHPEARPGFDLSAVEGSAESDMEGGDSGEDAEGSEEGV